jgi:NAD(P)-dependent dehydrogenase (short-subunit alcohol dehydrogenase family)
LRIKKANLMSKTILITGASTGFGRDITETLSKAGHRVFASMRDPDRRNRFHAEALRGQNIDVVELDVTDDASVSRAVQTVLAKAGHLDVLVNNAGAGTAGISEAFTTEQLQAIFDVNVFGIQRTLRAILPIFRKQGDGLVVNIGSVLGRFTLPFFGIYGATKFAVEALTDGYRYDLSQLGVDVVLVQPSAYPTNFFAATQAPDDQDRAQAYGEVSGIPQKLLETFEGNFKSNDAPNPHEVAEAILRLVQQPVGSRPDRVIVGAAFGADTVNAQAAAVQKQVLDNFGLGFLNTLRSAHTAV